MKMNSKWNWQLQAAAPTSCQQPAAATARATVLTLLVLLTLCAAFATLILVVVFVALTVSLFIQKLAQRVLRRRYRNVLMAFGYTGPRPLLRYEYQNKLQIKTEPETITAVAHDIFSSQFCVNKFEAIGASNWNHFSLTRIRCHVKDILITCPLAVGRRSPGQSGHFPSPSSDSCQTFVPFSLLLLHFGVKCFCNFCNLSRHTKTNSGPDVGFSGGSEQSEGAAQNLESRKAHKDAKTRIQRYQHSCKQIWLLNAVRRHGLRNACGCVSGCATRQFRFSSLNGKQVFRAASSTVVVAVDAAVDAPDFAFVL